MDNLTVVTTKDRITPGGGGIIGPAMPANVSISNLNLTDSYSDVRSINAALNYAVFGS